MLWEELRQDEFLDAVERANGVCVLPIGCVEAHGIHLPLGCDVMHVRHQATIAAKKEPVVVFPPIYFGEKAGSGEYPGTIIFPQSLIAQILEQCCKEIHRNGFKKILILNGHGGNVALLKNFACSTLLKKTGYIVYVYNASLDKSHPKLIIENLERFPYLTDEDVEILRGYVEEKKKDGHGGFIETGWLLDAQPELTRLDLMHDLDGRSTQIWDGFTARDIYTPFGWMANFPNSLSCSRHDGLNERIARAMTDLVTDAVADVYKFLKEETVSTDHYKNWEAKNPEV